MKKPQSKSLAALEGGKSVANDLDRVAPPGDKPANILYRTTKSTRHLLKEIALREDSTTQALLTEAINMLLISRGLDPTA